MIKFETLIFFCINKLKKCRISTTKFVSQKLTQYLFKFKYSMENVILYDLPIFYTFLSRSELY